MTPLDHLPTQEADAVVLSQPSLAPAVSPAPVRQDERIVALDAVRGFALLGILLLNILAFAFPDAATNNPYVAGGTSRLNIDVWFAVSVLFDGKFRAMFCMMFGASVYLLVDRLSRKGQAAEAADVHYRRMLWMMLFGLIHGYFLWYGDVLYLYAMMGLLLYPLRRLSPRSLLIGAAILLLGMVAYGGYQYQHLRHVHQQFLQAQADEQAGRKLTAEQEKNKKEWTRELGFIAPTADDLKEQDQNHRTWVALFLPRAQLVNTMHSGLFYLPGGWWDILYMMLIGMALLKLDILTGQRSYRFYAWMAALCLTFGLSLSWLATWLPFKQNFSPDVFWLSLAFYEPGRIAGLGYVALLLIMVKAGFLRGLTARLAAVGQTAFTNYILTTIICTTIFEGYGFGLWDRMQRWPLYGIVLAVWIVQLVISPLWLRYYRFGPLEWLWRSLTYWKKQPMRRATVPALGTPALAAEG